MHKGLRAASAACAFDHVPVLASKLQVEVGRALRGELEGQVGVARDVEPVEVQHADAAAVEASVRVGVVGKRKAWRSLGWARRRDLQAESLDPPACARRDLEAVAAALAGPRREQAVAPAADV